MVWLPDVVDAFNLFLVLFGEGNSLVLLGLGLLHVFFGFWTLIAVIQTLIFRIFRDIGGLGLRFFSSLAIGKVL